MRVHTNKTNTHRNPLYVAPMLHLTSSSQACPVRLGICRASQSWSATDARSSRVSEPALCSTHATLALPYAHIPCSPSPLLLPCALSTPSPPHYPHRVRQSTRRSFKRSSRTARSTRDEVTTTTAASTSVRMRVGPQAGHPYHMPTCCSGGNCATRRSAPRQR